MTEKALDKWVAQFAEELARMPRESFSVFFAYIAERLFPLYVLFQKKHKWGNENLLRHYLDSIWNMLEKIPHASVSADMLDHLGGLTPLGETFESPDSTYAQDCVICVDAALRALLSDQSLDGNWIEYGVEPIATKVLIEISGYSSIDSDDAEEWQARLRANREVADWLEDCEGMIKQLQREQTFVDVSEVRRYARETVVAGEQFLTP